MGERTGSRVFQYLWSYVFVCHCRIAQVCRGEHPATIVPLEGFVRHQGRRVSGPESAGRPRDSVAGLGSDIERIYVPVQPPPLGRWEWPISIQHIELSQCPCRAATSWTEGNS
ncbi:hypothetical protein B0T18DRAFT_406058 [Schizothecium vesticola]|uniref:Uncharacterized protein n=1 Tax=Schizothecium vesticola TaxID=314040 RepID=A0AA40K7V0_9PEZI|nr:hypothetical protein B0T18DRAFT_406058 [Schizothecium vesticola]